MSTNAQGERLRIAYIVGSFPNLSETFVTNQIVGVAARGHQVDIYTTWEGDVRYVPPEVMAHGLLQRTCSLAPRAGWAGVLATARVVAGVGWRAPRIMWRLLARLPRGGIEGAWRLWHASFTLIRRDTRHYDIVHAQFGPYGVFATQLIEVGALSGTIVTSFRGYDLGKYLRTRPQAYRGLFRAGALFLPVSQLLADRLVDAGCNPNHVRVHRSGISLRQMQYRESRPSEGPLRVITVARLVEKKGVCYAVEAVARAVAAGKSVSYTIVGDGPFRTELESQVRDLHMEKFISFAGAQAHSKVLEMVRLSHVLIAPSVTANDGDEEGVPNSLKEAMAIGLPVIGTRHGGIPELIEDGISGLLVDERDAAGLAECLTYLMEHPDLWPAMGHVARQRIAAEYDNDRLNDELIELYRGVLGFGGVLAESFPLRHTVIAPSYEGARRT